MSGDTYVMPVIRDVFGQQAADTTQWADTIDIRCWLQVPHNIEYAQYYANEDCKTCASLAGLLRTSGKF